MTNQIKTVVLLTLIGGLFLMVGYWAGGQAGMTTALVMAVVMNVGAYWFSDKIVLSMHHAQPVDRGHPSGLYEHVRDLAMRAGLPVPKVSYYPGCRTQRVCDRPQPSAFGGRGDNRTARYSR